MCVHVMCVCMYVCTCLQMSNENMCVYSYSSMPVCMHVHIYVIMFVCMFVCMYACMYVCTYVRIFGCMFVCMRICMHKFMYWRVVVYMLTCLHACMYVCIHVPSKRSRATHTHAHTRTHTPTHPHCLLCMYLLKFMSINLLRYIHVYVRTVSLDFLARLRDDSGAFLYILVQQPCVTWPIHMCDMTHSYVWHDTFLCVPWFIHTWDMTHS